MSRIAKILSVTILALLIPAQSFADQARWEQIFESSALRTYHGSEVTGVLVAMAGDPGRTLSEAAAGLRASYTNGRIVDLVMDDQALGSVTGLSDAEIVKKAKHLPVSHVAIVRIFGGKNGEIASAVVTVYDTWGSVYTSFAVKENQMLAFKPQRSSRPAAPARSSAPAPSPYPSPAAPQSTPIPSVSAKKLSGAPKKAAAPPPPAAPVGQVPITMGEKKYAKDYLWFGGPQLKKGKLKSWDKSSVAFQGSTKKRISGADFYTAAGRKDLAGKYRSKNRLRWGLILGGTAAAFGGIAYPIVSNNDCTELAMPEQPDCESQNSRRSTIGLVIAGAGALSWLVGWAAVNPHPVGAKEAQKLVDTHNAGLRKKHNVPDYFVPRVEPKGGKKDKKKDKKKKSSLQIQPLVGTDGGGLMVFGRF